MSVIAWLRTPVATLIVLCSALLAQLPHAADVFRLIVMGDGVWPVLHSYTYAIALELAVLLFVVQRRNVESYLFAAVSILVNLSYYYLHGVALFTLAALPAWLVSIALPAAIAQYSHLIAAATGATETHAATQPRAWRWRFWRKPATPDATPHAPAPTAAVEPDAVRDTVQPSARAVALQMADEGCSVAQIAAQIDAKPATVRSWIARARAKQNGGTHA